MNVYTRTIAGREFLILEGVANIPIDRIRYLDYNVAKGGATGASVRIVTDDDNEDWTFAYANCEAIRQFFEEQ